MPDDRKPKDMADEWEDEGLAAPTDEDPTIAGTMPPKDYPVAATDYGTTGAEQRTQEPFAQRDLRYRPDTANAEEPGSRTVAPDEGGFVDDEGTEVARDVDQDAGLSAEEAAVHETREV